MSSREYQTRRTSPYHAYTRRLLQGRSPNIPDDLVDYMSTYVVSDSTDPFQFVVEGNLYQLSLLHQYGSLDINDWRYVALAVQYGHTDILRWMVEEGFFIPTDIPNHGRVPNFTGLEPIREEFEDDDEPMTLLDMAFRSDSINFEIMDILHSLNIRPTYAEEPFIIAVRSNNKDLLHWLIQNGFSKEYALYRSLVDGNQEMAQELIRLGTPIPKHILEMVAEGGNVDLMAWLISQGYSNMDDDVDLLFYAMKSRNMEMIRYVHDVLRYPLTVQVLSMSRGNRYRNWGEFQNWLNEARNRHN